MILTYPLVIAFLFIIGILIYIYWKKKKVLALLNELNIKLLESNDEFKEILLLGIYHRFKKENYKIDIDKQDENNKTQKESITNLFSLKKPYDFEVFAADVLKDYYGGGTYVTRRSGDYGVDFEHNRQDGLYLGQVKCEKTDLSFKPIALIHSNMIKENAIGGYVVTTSDFSENAKNYAEGLNIELINGEKLVNYYLENLEKKIEIVKTTQKLKQVKS